MVIGVTYLLWATVVAHPSETDWSVWFSPMSRAADFGIGAALAVISAAGVRLGRGARVTAGLVGIASLAMLVMNRPESAFGAWWAPFYALAIAVGLSGIVLHDGPWPAAFSWRPLAWIGGLGYGIYLIHEPVMRILDHVGALPSARPGPFFLITAVLVGVVAVALAWVSSKTVEAAGLKLLATIQKDGTPRDYYAHLDPAERKPEPART